MHHFLAALLAAVRRHPITLSRDALDARAASPHAGTSAVAATPSTEPDQGESLRLGSETDRQS